MPGLARVVLVALGDLLGAIEAAQADRCPPGVDAPARGGDEELGCPGARAVDLRPTTRGRLAGCLAYAQGPRRRRPDVPVLEMRRPASWLIQSMLTLRPILPDFRGSSTTSTTAAVRRLQVVGAECIAALDGHRHHAHGFLGRGDADHLGRPAGHEDAPVHGRHGAGQADARAGQLAARHGHGQRDHDP